jgi:hypothetical protein
VNQEPIIDLSWIQHYIPNIAAWLGLDPATVLLLLTILVTVCNLAARLIPDTATGWLGGIRKVAKIVGMFVPNRVASGITVNDVAKAVVANKVTDLKSAVESEAKSVMRDQLENKIDQ